MTREQAIDKIRASINRTHRTVGVDSADAWTHGLADFAEALGLIEYDEPPKSAPTALDVIADVGSIAPLETERHPDYFEFTRHKIGYSYASRIVLALEQAGFKIVRADP
jgi:hypothetical protein